MLFKKSEPRRWHPCLVMTIGALSVIGAVTVASVTKDVTERIKNRMMSIMKRRSSSTMRPIRKAEAVLLLPPFSLPHAGDLCILFSYQIYLRELYNFLHSELINYVLVEIRLAVAVKHKLLILRNSRLVFFLRLVI